MGESGGWEDEKKLSLGCKMEITWGEEEDGEGGSREKDNTL